MTFNELSKEEVAKRQPGKENRACPNTGMIRRDCSCMSCRGRRSRRKGQVKQRQARRQLEKVFLKPAGPSMMATANEETWRLPVRAEVKSGGMAKTVDTFYRNTKTQADKDKAIGDVRPFVAIAMVDGSTDGLCVIRNSDLVQLFEEARR